MSTNTTPWVQTVTLTPPSLKDNTADADRLVQALKSRLGTAVIDVDPDLLKALQAAIRWPNPLSAILKMRSDLRNRCRVLNSE